MGFISGAQFRVDMRFGTGESLALAWRAVPDLIADIQRGANVAFSVVPIAGAVILLRRDPWAGWLTVAIVVANVYMFVGYRGDLPHYLLLTWLILAVWLAVAVEAAVGWLRSRLGPRLDEAEFALVAVAALFLASNWAAHDQSGNRLGEDYTRTVFDRLPQDALLVTYWDTLTTLSYAHCIDGERPDIALQRVVPCSRGSAAARRTGTGAVNDPASRPGRAGTPGARRGPRHGGPGARQDQAAHRGGGPGRADRSIAGPGLRARAERAPRGRG